MLRQFRKFLKWAGLGVASLLLLTVAILMLVGFPRPPAIKAENVGRLGWRPLWDNLGMIREQMRSKALVGWLPNGEGMIVRGSYWVFDSRLYVQADPGAKPVLLSRIPRNAAGLHTTPGRGYVIFRWDSDGDEQFQLYRWDLDASEPMRLTSGKEQAFFGAFEPDGARIAYTSTRRNGTDYDIFLMDPRDASTDASLMNLKGSWSIADWSPVADELLLVRNISSLENELHVLNLDTRTLALLTNSAGGAAYHGSPQWSRDGTAIYFASDRGTEFRHLRRLNLATGEETILSEEIPWDVLSVQQSGDGKLLLIGVNEDGRTRYYVRDMAQERTRPLDFFSSGLIGAVLHRKEPLLIVNHSDERGISRGYIYDLRSEKLTLWAGQEPLASEVPDARLVQFPTFDSIGGAARLISAFVYPGVGGGSRPVLIDIHGGPEGQAGLRTDPGRTLFPKYGITLITPNVRGSTGYGRTFTRLDDGYRREDAVRDIGALLDWIAEQPELDETRVMVTGGSYGGYMVLASLVHFSGRIRCGVAHFGISNFVSFLGNTADYRRDLRRAEYGDERDPKMRAFLDSISPLNRADRIVSRLMVVQGARDPRVPVTEARQIVERVRGKGSHVSYIEAANEGHGFINPWNFVYTQLAELKMAQECLLR